MKTINKLVQLASLLIVFVAHASFAVDSVNPTGVNVRSNGATTVFLTFRGTQGQTSSDAFWCGEITVPANTVTNTNPCVPGTLFGNLPAKSNLSRPSAGIGGVTGTAPGDSDPGDTDGPTDLPAKPNAFLFSNPASKTSQSNGANFTDIMTIPPSVARRAMQSARQGANSSFFYVRKFESQGVEQYIAVTCRMAGGGARVPFALIEVSPHFTTEQGPVPVHLAAIGEQIPSASVDIHYNGSGRLKGRWELVQPGETAPSDFDLLPEASLPIEQRGLQKRYTVIQRFDEFLPPNGVTTLKGPSSKLLKNTLIGPYQLLLRIEATRDKEGDSDTGVGVVNSGGVAGFAIPPLRYYVATEEDVSQAKRHAGLEKTIVLLSPAIRGIMSGTAQDNGSLQFVWQSDTKAKIYIVEIEFENGERYQAIKKQNQYEAPPWLKDRVLENNGAKWRVSALNSTNQRIGRSDWREL